MSGNLVKEASDEIFGAGVLDNFPKEYSPRPSDEEILQALGKNATPDAIKAYCKGAFDSWKKAILMPKGTILSRRHQIVPVNRQPEADCIFRNYIEAAMVGDRDLDRYLGKILQLLTV